MAGKQREREMLVAGQQGTGADQRTPNSVTKALCLSVLAQGQGEVQALLRAVLMPSVS